MVKAHTRRSKSGRLVTVNQYYRSGKRRKVKGYTYQPDTDTAAVYDPKDRTFQGRIPEGEPVPRGLKRYRFDDTKLVQRKEKNRYTMGRTEG